MNAKSAFGKFSFAAVILGVIAALTLLFCFHLPVLIFLFAYLLSYAFTGSNFFVMSKIHIRSNKKFFSWFAASLGIRFSGAIIGIILGLKILNSHEILFTVSFLFSYLCHSVIEIIYLNKILKTDP